MVLGGDYGCCMLAICSMLRKSHIKFARKGLKTKSAHKKSTIAQDAPSKPLQ